ncbi:MAG: HEAT repeat domain-containing protein, partial [Phycisphaerae bacterium]
MAATLTFGQATKPVRTADEAREAILARRHAAERDEVARTLFSDPRSSAVVVSLLEGAEPSILSTLAGRLAAAPESFRAEYIPPLFAALTSPTIEATERVVVANALAAAPEDWISGQLRTWLQDDATPAARTAALQVLARTHRYQHIALLIERLRARPENEHQEVLDALSQTTGIPFGTDAASALEWWSDVCQRPATEWQRLRLHESLAALRKARAAETSLEARLSAVMREGYLREPPPTRPTVLRDYLHDDLPVVRRVGLELLQEQLTAGQLPSPELLDEARDLLKDPEDRVSAAAVRTVVALRDGADESTFIAMLQNGAGLEQRRALINALGYVGGEAGVDVLLKILRQQPQQTSVDLVTALARAVERNICSATQQDALQGTLVAFATDEKAADPAFEAQVIWTLGLLKKPESREILNQAIRGENPLIVRQAAIRGLALWGDPEVGKTIYALIEHRDLRIRRTALEAASKFVQDAGKLETLVRRSLQRYEPDDTNRKLAWRIVNQCVEQ